MKIDEVKLDSHQIEYIPNQHRLIELLILVAIRKTSEYELIQLK